MALEPTVARSHWADHAFGWVGRKPLYFADGFGPRDALERALEGFVTFDAPASPPPLTWVGPWQSDGVVARREATFVSPAREPYALPEAARTARVLFVRPRREAARAACVQLASTGDLGWRRRYPLARALARHGVASALLENPYYGPRKPPSQQGCAVRTALDHVVMNRATIDEARALVALFHREGLARVALAGFSMGAQMAALTAASLERPVACAPLGGGASGESVFLEGVFCKGLDWAALEGDEARMRVLCEQTAVSRAKRPVRPDAAVLVAARHDAYVAPRAAEALAELWPGSELRWVDGGHISLFVRGQGLMRGAVLDALAKL